MHTQLLSPMYDIDGPDVRTAASVGTEACDATALLEFCDVGFGFDEDPCGLFGDVNLTICQGEVVAIQGDNGTGKSCLIRLAMGIYPPRVGRIRLFGRPPGHHDHIPRLGFVGGVPQADGDLPMPPDLPITLFRNIVSASLSDAGADLAWAGFVAEELQLDAPSVRGKKFGQLSKGWQLRFQLWAALAKPVTLLLLDEPFDGLFEDIKPTVFNLLREVVRRNEAAVLLVTHHPSEAFDAGAGRLFKIKDQRLCEVPAGEFQVSVMVDGKERVNSCRTISAKELYEIAGSAAASRFLSAVQFSAKRVIGGEG